VESTNPDGHPRGLVQSIVFEALRADALSYCQCSGLRAANTILCIILSAVLAIGILYAPPDSYRYAPPGLHKKARTAIVKLKLKLDLASYGPRQPHCAL